MGLGLLRYSSSSCRFLFFDTNSRKESPTFQAGVYGSQLGNRGTIEYFNALGVDFVCFLFLPLQLIYIKMVCSLEQLPVAKVASAQAYISMTKGQSTSFPPSQPILVLEPHWADPFDLPFWI
jgi:hypothetical protein